MSMKLLMMLETHDVNETLDDANETLHVNKTLHANEALDDEETHNKALNKFQQKMTAPLNQMFAAIETDIEFNCMFKCHNVIRFLF